MTPHLSVEQSGKEIPLIPFVDRILREASLAAPCVLHVEHSDKGESAVQWRVFSAAKNGQLPSIVATMDAKLFRSALAYLSASFIRIDPYFGARQFHFKNERGSYQCVGMIQNTPKNNWASITFLDSSQPGAAANGGPARGIASRDGSQSP